MLAAIFLKKAIQDKDQVYNIIINFFENCIIYTNNK